MFVPGAKIPLPPGFIYPPCLPSPSQKPPSGSASLCDRPPVFIASSYTVSSSLPAEHNFVYPLISKSILLLQFVDDAVLQRASRTFLQIANVKEARIVEKYPCFQEGLGVAWQSLEH
jgi:hypothetical protein